MSSQELVQISSPGKLFLLGEHFVVMGAPALLTTVDLRCNVSLSPRSDQQITIASGNLGSQEFSIQEILERRSIAQAQWDQFRESGNVGLLTEITKELLAYASISIGEALHYYGAKLNRGFGISIDSQIPVGAGLGSSAATSVSLAAAVALHLGHQLTLLEINDIAYEAEKRRHGNPSGADNSTVTFGGVIRFVREPKTIETLNLGIPENLSSNFVLIDTGKPNESTGEMVAKVAQLRRDNPSLVNAALTSQTMLIQELIDSVVPSGDEAGFVRVVKAGEQNLENIGVVSPSSIALIRAIEKTGGAAKICGAGGVRGSTGIVLAYHPDRKLVETVAKDKGLSFFSTTLGVEGLRREK